MNSKHKSIREREVEHNYRYNKAQTVNYESTPSLLRVKQHAFQNKENNHNAHNYISVKQEPKLVNLNFAKSMEFQRRLQTEADMGEVEFGQFKKNKHKHYADEISCSHDFGGLRNKLAATHLQEGFFKEEHLAFGDVGQRNGLVSSRDFIEEKKVKNELIDQMMANNKRLMCKSFDESNLGGGYCVNHPSKKAKYRLIAELSEGEQERFYCSKCAINLLQQNFKIEQIKGEDGDVQNNSMRLQQITKFELRLKSIEERTRFETERSYAKEELQIIQEQIQNANKKFKEVIQALQLMRSEHISGLNQIYMRKQNQEKGRRDDLAEMLSNMRDIQQQIKQYKNMKKFAVMKENEFQFITSSLNNKINKFDEILQKMKPPSPCNRLSVQSITNGQIIQRLQQEIMGLKESGKKRRVREITFSRRDEPKQRMSEDEFACDELKRPFRVLFPSDQMDQSQSIEEGSQKGRMLNSVRERSGCSLFQ